MQLECNGTVIKQKGLITSVKMICSSKTCSQSGFIHAECFRNLEDILIRHITFEARTWKPKQVHTFRKYNWDTEADRNHLWRLGHLNHHVYMHVKCRCGGLLQKDLAWPPRKLPRRKMGDSKKTTMPKLNYVGEMVKHAPTVTQMPSWLQEEQGQSRNVPGARFVTAKPRLRGVVGSWEGGTEGQGTITDPDTGEKMCGVRAGALEGQVVWEEVVGQEVEYSTRRRGRRTEATSVTLLGVRRGREEPCEGVVTHWIPEQLAGIIATGEGEVLVCRGDFRPGGFQPDIVGRNVTFSLDRLKMEARCVEAQDLAEGRKSELHGGVISLEGAMEQQVLASSLEQLVLGDAPGLEEVKPLLSRLSSVPSHHKTVAKLLSTLRSPDLELVVSSLSSQAAALAVTESGAHLLLTALSLLPPSLVHLLVSFYASLCGEDAVVVQLIHPSASTVFQASLPHLGPKQLVHLVQVLGSEICSLRLTSHPSLELLVRRLLASASASLVVVASSLDRHGMLLSPRVRHLLPLLLQARSPAVSGVFLNRLAGKLDQLIKEELGREVVADFLSHAMELQVELLMAELLWSKGGTPLVVVLATMVEGESIMGVVLKVARWEVLERMLEVFLQWKDKVLGCREGREWFRMLKNVLDS